jgi:hypothetical protein
LALRCGGSAPNKSFSAPTALSPAILWSPRVLEDIHHATAKYSAGPIGMVLPTMLQGWCNTPPPYKPRTYFVLVSIFRWIRVGIYVGSAQPRSTRFPCRIVFVRDRCVVDTSALTEGGVPRSWQPTCGVARFRVFGSCGLSLEC